MPFVNFIPWKNKYVQGKRLKKESFLKQKYCLFICSVVTFCLLVYLISECKDINAYCNLPLLFTNVSYQGAFNCNFDWNFQPSWLWSIHREQNEATTVRPFQTPCGLNAVSLNSFVSTLSCTVLFLIIQMHYKFIPKKQCGECCFYLLVWHLRLKELSSFSKAELIIIIIILLLESYILVLDKLTVNDNW